jgi:hypothetical protein
MPPSERASALRVSELVPSPFSSFFRLVIPNQHSPLYLFSFNPDHFFIPVMYGVVNPDNLDPVAFYPAGYTETITPTLNPDLPESQQDLTPYDIFYEFSDATYDESTIQPYIAGNPQVSFPENPKVSFPNYHVLEGDWRVPAFSTHGRKLCFVVAVIPPWPWGLVPFVQSFSGVVFDSGGFHFDNATETYFSWVNQVIYTPYFLLGYEIEFTPSPDASAPPSYTVTSKVWNQDTSQPEDADDTSFFCRLPLDFRLPGQPDNVTISVGVSNFRDRFVASLVAGLNRIKPEVTFLDRPQQPHLYNIENPCI